MANDSINRQVIDIKAIAGVGDISNEVLRRWTDKGYEMAVKEGNYDRSREHLNFEIMKGGKIVPVDKDQTARCTYGRTPCRTWHQRPEYRAQ